MAFKEDLKTKSAYIEDLLKQYMPKEEGYQKTIFEAMNYSLSSGGKRLRPILTLESAKIIGGDVKEVIPFCVAIEMIHTYSLIHDDLPAMDNDDLRRGKPTNHKVFGDGIATLAGDALLNEAMIIMMKFSLKNGENALRASKEIAEAAGSEGMIGGQVVDIINEGKSQISEDELKYMHAKKTGELIRAAIVSGAILAEAPKKDIEAFDLFGRKLGLAFQIKDDILDVTGSTEKLGKKAHADEELNKCNFITMYGLEKCEKLCKDLSYESISLLNSITKDTSYLKELTLSLLEREY